MTFGNSELWTANYGWWDGRLMGFGFSVEKQKEQLEKREKQIEADGSPRSQGIVHQVCKQTHTTVGLQGGTG